MSIHLPRISVQKCKKLFLEKYPDGDYKSFKFFRDKMQPKQCNTKIIILDFCFAFLDEIFQCFGSIFGISKIQYFDYFTVHNNHHDLLQAKPVIDLEGWFVYILEPLN